MARTGRFRKRETPATKNEKYSPKSTDEQWRWPLTRECPYVYVNDIYLKRSWGDSYENVAVMVAVGVNEDEYREATGCAEGFTESFGVLARFPVVTEVAQAARHPHAHRRQGISQGRDFT